MNLEETNINFINKKLRTKSLQNETRVHEILYNLRVSTCPSKNNKPNQWHRTQKAQP